MKHWLYGLSLICCNHSNWNLRWKGLYGKLIFLARYTLIDWESEEENQLKGVCRISSLGLRLHRQFKTKSVVPVCIPPSLLHCYSPLPTSAINTLKWKMQRGLSHKICWFGFNFSWKIKGDVTSIDALRGAVRFLPVVVHSSGAVASPPATKQSWRICFCRCYENETNFDNQRVALVSFRLFWYPSSVLQFCVRS